MVARIFLEFQSFVDREPPDRWLLSKNAALGRVRRARRKGGCTGYIFLPAFTVVCFFFFTLILRDRIQGLMHTKQMLCR